jgi:hypothetical protein
MDEMLRICKIECHPQVRYSDSGESAIVPGRSQIISSLVGEGGFRGGKAYMYLQLVSINEGIRC